MDEECRDFRSLREVLWDMQNRRQRDSLVPHCHNTALALMHRRREQKGVFMTLIAY